MKTLDVNYYPYDVLRGRVIMDDERIMPEVGDYYFCQCPKCRWASPNQCIHDPVHGTVLICALCDFQWEPYTEQEHWNESA